MGLVGPVGCSAAKPGGQAGPTLEAIDNEVGPVGLEPTINAV